MNEVNENVTVNGAGTQDEEPAAKNNETKAEKFIRFGEYRMNKAIDAIGRCTVQSGAGAEGFGAGTGKDGA